MTVYLFDKWKKVRRIIPTGGVTELIHDEGAYTLTAQVAAELKVINGEYLGFRCVDGRFRMFEVSGANLDDERHVIDITAADAIVQELSEEITEDLQQLDVDLATAIKSILPGAEWVVKGKAPDRLENSRAYYAPAWTMLQTYEQLYEWRIIPYYSFDGGKITEKVIELQEDKAVFRGRILRSRKDAAKVYVTKTGRPITRLYGLGPAQGSQDLQTNLTFADVEWSVANGDPADKPKGQAWIEDPAAVALHGVHTAVVSITDAEDADDLLKKTWEQMQIMQMPTVKADATISDMEMVPGHSHEQIRIGDLVAMRLDAGYAVEARIIGIKRNYIRRWLTKITIGDKTATLQSQVADLIASATHTFERLTIYQNRFKEDEELIQLNAAVIQLNAEHIQENANTLIEHAQWILNQAKLIELRATKDDLDKVVVRLDAAEGTLTAQADTITAQGQLIQANADDIEANAQSILAQAEQLLLKATQGDLDKVVVRLDSAEGTMTAQAKEILLKADMTYVDNLVADYATIAELNAVNAELSNLIGGLVTATVLSSNLFTGNELDVTYANVDALTHNGEVVSQRTITMGDIGTVGKALSAGGTLDLQHSHSVTVNEDGTITFGEVATTGGSFKIADTKYYKDGVSAARTEGTNSVTLSSMGWVGGSNIVKASNGKSVTVGLPAFSASGGDVFNGEHKTTVYFYTDGVTGPLQSVVVDASSVYEEGYQAALNSIWLDAAITSITNVAANTMQAAGYARAYSGDTLVTSMNLSKSQVFPNLGQ